MVLPRKARKHPDSASGDLWRRGRCPVALDLQRKSREGQEQPGLRAADPAGRREGKESHAIGGGEAVWMAPGATYWLFCLCQQGPYAAGGTSWQSSRMDEAIAAAKAQWQKGVWQEVQVVSEMFEAVEGQLQLDERGLVEGLARCTWPHGETYEGSYHQGKRHKRADGSSYVGQYRDGLMHGRGTFQWADGTVAVFTFEADQPKGLGVRLEKASSRYVLLKDGKTEREIDRAEAWQSDLRDVFRGGNSCRSMPG